MMTRAFRDNSSSEVTPTGIPLAHMRSMSAVDLALGGEECCVLPLGVPQPVQLLEVFKTCLWAHWAHKSGEHLGSG